MTTQEPCQPDLYQIITHEDAQFIAENVKRQASSELDTPEKVVARLPKMRALKKEHFVALYLDARHREIARETVSIGTLTASLVHPREFFGPALKHGAVGIIAIHNHPSGDHSPSSEDREVTRRLVKAGELLGITLVDHVIIAAGGHFSFRAQGLL